MKIYRVENREGLGPYRNTDWQPWEHGNALTHPCPRFDKGLNYIKSCEKCAFKSYRQLRDWFTKEELAELKTMGYDIIKLEVDRKLIRFGKKQIVYQFR